VEAIAETPEGLDTSEQRVRCTTPQPKAGVEMSTPHDSSCKANPGLKDDSGLLGIDGLRAAISGDTDKAIEGGAQRSRLA
jgi:hypothetical protein